MGGYCHITNGTVIWLHSVKENTLIDYKFYCFSGEPKFLYVADSNFIDGEKHDLLTYLDLEWKPTPFDRPDHPKMVQKVSKPDKLGEMLTLASKLAAELPFVRTDFYNIDGNVYFSELTFYPGSGFGAFEPEEWERKIGDWISLPTV